MGLAALIVIGAAIFSYTMVIIVGFVEDWFGKWGVIAFVVFIFTTGWSYFYLESCDRIKRLEKSNGS